MFLLQRGKILLDRGRSFDLNERNDNEFEILDNRCQLPDWIKLEEGVEKSDDHDVPHLHGPDRHLPGHAEIEIK